MDVHRPQREHTDIEEELHEVAHIDYNRVSIVNRPLSMIFFHGSLTNRSPILLSQLCTKMPWCMKQAQPSPQQEL